MEEITIIVGANGEVNFDVTGVKGSNCKDLTKKMEEALGSTVKCDNKQEYYEQENHLGKQQGLGGEYGGGDYNG
jgi:hypothetical protein